MNISEVERIKDLISKAELESAKSKGVIESIENQWLEEFGTKDLSEIEKKLNDMNEELNKLNERMENLYSKLLNSYDWDKLEQELA